MNKTTKEEKVGIIKDAIRNALQKDFNFGSFTKDEFAETLAERIELSHKNMQQAEAYRSGALDELSNLYRDILDHDKNTWTKKELRGLINKRAKNLKR